MASFTNWCMNYYESVKVEDEILYPGYHMHLLDDASGTNIYKMRADLMEFLHFHEEYLSAVVKHLVDVEFKLDSFGLDPAEIPKVSVNKFIVLSFIVFPNLSSNMFFVFIVGTGEV